MGVKGRTSDRSKSENDVKWFDDIDFLIERFN